MKDDDDDVVIKILKLHSADSECVCVCVCVWGGGFPLFLSRTNSFSNVRELAFLLLNRGNCFANSLHLSSSGDFW